MQTAESAKDFVVPTFLVIAAFVPIFLLCELGERLTDRFNQIDNTVLQCNWYKYPKNVRKMLPIIISDTQQSFVFVGLGNIQCSRDAFKNVSHLFTNL